MSKVFTVTYKGWKIRTAWGSEGPFWEGTDGELMVIYANTARELRRLIDWNVDAAAAARAEWKASDE